ncbi:MAG TPA: hypothetical protein VGL49_04615 [Acidimicrobiales bacterium]|jgi:hypothetical protein
MGATNPPAQFQEGAVRVEQQGDPLADWQLASLAMTLGRGLPAAAGGLLRQLVDVAEQAEHPGPAFGEARVPRIDGGREDGGGHDRWQARA